MVREHPRTQQEDLHFAGELLMLKPKPGGSLFCTFNNAFSTYVSCLTVTIYTRLHSVATGFLALIQRSVFSLFSYVFFSFFLMLELLLYVKNTSLRFIISVQRDFVLLNFCLLFSHRLLLRGLILYSAVAFWLCVYYVVIHYFVRFFL